MIELSEADVKRGCEDYLEVMKAQRKLIYFRLNAGDFIDTRGGSRRRIKGAGAGTADLIVIQPGQVHLEYMKKQQGPGIPVAFTTFIECKSSKGKLRKEQLEFSEMVKNLHCKYVVVRNVDDLVAALERE